MARNYYSSSSSSLSKITAIGIKAELINLISLKPLDLDSILASCQKTQALLIISEEQLGAGFNAYLAQQILKAIGEKLTKPFATEFMAVNNTFGESGKAEQLLKKYQLDSQAILSNILFLLKKKREMLKN